VLPTNKLLRSSSERFDRKELVYQSYCIAQLTPKVFQQGARNGNAKLTVMPAKLRTSSTSDVLSVPPSKVPCRIAYQLNADETDAKQKGVGTPGST
jgi:hypothetical protein